MSRTSGRLSTGRRPRLASMVVLRMPSRSSRLRFKKSFPFFPLLIGNTVDVVGVRIATSLPLGDLLLHQNESKSFAIMCFLRRRQYRACITRVCMPASASLFNRPTRCFRDMRVRLLPQAFPDTRASAADTCVNLRPRVLAFTGIMAPPALVQKHTWEFLCVTVACLDQSVGVATCI